MKISEVLWEAANEHLSENWESGMEYSCSAISRAAYGPRTRMGGYADKERTMHFLFGLGLRRNAPYSHNIFSRVAPRGFERQAARYTWLMLAYTIAKEEGL